MAKKPRKDRKPALEPLYDHELEKAVSMTECTGMFPTPVMDMDASESYASLYAVPPPKLDPKWDEKEWHEKKKKE